MATIKEIAKESRVSIATVSNIIHGKPGASEKTRKKVMEVIERLDYTPNVIAQNLKQKFTKTIGIITEDLTVFNTSNIVDGINEYCDEHGYQFVLGNLRLYKKYDKKFYNSNKYYSRVNDEFKLMLSKQVEGIIYIACHCRELKCIPKNFPIPITIAYSFVKSNEYSSIIFDDEQGAYEATTQIIENGNRKIGVICGLSESLHTKQRLIGYQRALYDNNILFNPSYLYYGDWERMSGYEGCKELVEKGVTAIFCMNDVMAGGVYDYSNYKRFVIGKDISLVGFDNREISQAYNPKLATMALPLFDIGQKAADILINSIKDGNKKRENKSYKIECKFVNGESL